MKTDFTQELAPDVRVKMKKNLLYIGMFSIVMMFAGFTSAYIVSMGDSFWLKYPLPSAFWISTVLILVSSLLIELGIRFVKKGSVSRLKAMLLATFLIGLGFVYYQFKGYGQLIQMGAHAINNHIVVTDGRYGDYYEIKKGNDFFEVDGNNYMLKGKQVSASELKQLQAFMDQFLALDRDKELTISTYSKPFVLYFENQPLGLINGKLTKPDGKVLEYVDLMRLRDLARNIHDGRGDFFVRGQIGEDFHIFYKGKELGYNNRILTYKGQPLNKFMQIKAIETADTATSYLYIITFLHLLHIAVTLIYMGRLVIYSFTGKYDQNDHLSVRLGAIFWHFLGALWVYLLLFLLFIH